MSSSVDPPLFKSVLGTVPATDSVLLKAERPVLRLPCGRRQSALSSAGRYRICETTQERASDTQPGTLLSKSLAACTCSFVTLGGLGYFSFSTSERQGTQRDLCTRGGGTGFFLLGFNRNLSPVLYPSDIWCLGLPEWCNHKEPASQYRRHKRRGLDPWVGKIPWRRELQPTPVFLPGEFHGPRSLVGCSPWGHKELDTTEHLSLTSSITLIISWHRNYILNEITSFIFLLKHSCLSLSNFQSCCLTMLIGLKGLGWSSVARVNRVPPTSRTVN